MRRKDIKKDKVLKAITIGLATMLAVSSTPLTAFAEENEGSTEPSSNESGSGGGQESGEPNSGETQETGSSGGEENTGGSEESSPSVDDQTVQEIKEEVAEDYQPAQEAASSSTEEIVEAFNACSDESLLTNPVAAPAIVNDIVADINGADKDVKEIGTGLDTAQESETEAQISVAQADLSISQFEADMSSYNSTVQSLENNAAAVTTQADIANNNSNSIQVRKDAKEAAGQNLQNSKDNLAESEKKLAKAAADEEKARTDYETAQSDYEQAERDVEALEGLKNKSESAKKQLAEAKANAAKLKERAEENQKSLEAMESQYEATLIQFFREITKTATYAIDENGEVSLDIKTSTEKALQNNKINGSSTENANLLGRNLMQQIVTYMIKNDENVDWENADFKFGEKESRMTEKDRKPAYQGVVFESDDNIRDEKGKSTGHGQLQVTINKDRSSRGNAGAGDVKAGPDVGFYWSGLGRNDGGRTNRVHVTYKDKDGNLHDEYYNYIYKDTSKDDVEDIASSGPMFLGMIKQDTQTGKWSVVKVNDDKDFYNYSKLQSAIEAAQDLSQFGTIESEIKEAQDEVDRLQTEIDKIANRSIDKGYLNSLKERLISAQSALKEAQDNKEELTQIVEEAQRVFDSILILEPATGGGENTTPPAADTGSEEDPDEDAGTLADEAPAPAAVSDSAGPRAEDISSYIESTLRTVPSLASMDISIGSPSGVAGVRRGASDSGVAGVRTYSPDELQAMLDGVAPTLDKVYDQKDNINTSVEKDTSMPKYKRLEDNQVPLASTPLEEKDHGFSWLWAAIAACAAAIVKTIHTERRRILLAKRSKQEDHNERAE